MTIQDKPILIFIKGANGTGKTTVANHLYDSLVEQVGHQCVEIRFAGSMLSREVKLESEIGHKIAPYIKNSKHVPTELVWEVVFKQPITKKFCIIEGYPRNVKMGNFAIDKFRGWGMLERCIVFGLNYERGQLDLKSRIICANCNGFFDLDKAKCRLCQSERSTTRKDDENFLFRWITEYRNMHSKAMHDLLSRLNNHHVNLDLLGDLLDPKFKHGCNNRYLQVINPHNDHRRLVKGLTTFILDRFQELR